AVPLQRSWLQAPGERDPAPIPPRHPCAVPTVACLCPTYDNLLEWPFSYRVTFSLLDQSDPSLSKPQHITETFHPDPNWKNFQKPGASRSSLDESTLGFGYPKFISHEDIKKRNYVRDNAIFIKASVEIPQKILA
uniref:TRAF1-6 MATH domain-containing protein n=1 Tax=Buteo japonicus TaxID=224669 RepID=A0A8C0BVL5_9AVES